MFFAAADDVERRAGFGVGGIASSQFFDPFRAFQDIIERKGHVPDGLVDVFTYGSGDIEVVSSLRTRLTCYAIKLASQRIKIKSF